MADGFEFAAAGDAGFIASSGGLQLWEGFDDDISLDAGEAWSTLVVTSPDDQEWTPHLLGGLALWQIVPFDGGWLGLGMLKPERNTEVIVIDGQETLVAVDPPSTLYYSADGVQWEHVIGSPSLGRPAMALVGSDQVVVVDQADREGPVQIHRIEKRRP
jgi:hypothetical protein